MAGMSETVGEILRRTRKERKVSLEQVSTATHIRLHYLEALERDDRDSLPSRVQGKGFLRLYADYLNLRTEALLAQWEGKPFVEPVQVEDVVEAQTAGTARRSDSTAPECIGPFMRGTR